MNQVTSPCTHSYYTQKSSFGNIYRVKNSENRNRNHTDNKAFISTRSLTVKNDNANSHYYSKSSNDSYRPYTHLSSRRNNILLSSFYSSPFSLLIIFSAKRSLQNYRAGLVQHPSKNLETKIPHQAKPECGIELKNLSFL